MKILVVEDDRTVAQTLELLFSSYNYAVDIATDGESGLQMVDAFEYDLILLDVILPKKNGIEVCQQLRERGFKSPVLLLTGQGAAQQKAIALNAGADDYVVKPFDAEELIARVQALLRRGNITSEPLLSWGKLSIDPSSRQVTYDTSLLSVTPKEYAILELFLRSPQKVFSASTILDRVWTSLEYPGEEAVRVHIKELRQKLKAAGAPKDIIKTKHRVGYQLNPLYSSEASARGKPESTVPNVDKLTSTNEELHSALEQLQATRAELERKNRELEIAHRTIEQQRHREEALRESEGRYRTLFKAIDAGFSVCELVRDESGSAVDYRFLEIDSAAARIMGISRSDAVGRLNSDILPGIDEGWPRTYQQVVDSGESIRFERYIELLDRWFDITAFPYGGDRFAIVYKDITTLQPAEIGLLESEQRLQVLENLSGGAVFSHGTPLRAASGEVESVLVAAHDITQLKQAEALLHQNQERQAFLLELSNALRPIADPVEIQETVARILMERFKADRCYYCEIEDGHAIIGRDACREDLPSVAGVYPLSSFPIWQAAISAGHPLVIRDVSATDTVDENLRQLCIQLQVIAYINVPIVKNGKPVGALCLVQSKPRDWTGLEVEVAVETADRIGSAVERARTEAALHQAQQHLEVAVEAAEMGTWYLDLRENISPQRSLRHDRIFGYDTPQIEWGEAIARRHVVPEDRDLFDAAFARARETGELNFEVRVQWPDRSIHWMAARGRFYFDESGNPLYGGGVNFDITERKQIEAALQQREAQLAAELADTQQLQRISTQLIPEENIESLYEQILEAAIAIMRSDMGTIQILDPERNELQLLVAKGLDPASAVFWQWVGVESSSACSIALKRGDRVILPDVEESQSAIDIGDLEAFRFSGIRATQATPLLSRDGSVVGMISTQWRSPHQPSERELDRLDVLARQAADLIERARNRQEIESDLRNTQLLHQLATRPPSEEEPQSLYQEILETAIALMRADAGTVRIYEEASQELVLLATQGFDPEMSEHFYRVGAGSKTSCGRALATGERAFVDFDGPESEDSDGALRMHLEAGYLCAQSTPLISRSGKTIGMVTTHWRERRRASAPQSCSLRDRELRFLDLLARQAADAIERQQTATALQEREELLRTMTQAGLWCWEVATGKLNWSPEAYRLHGLDSDGEPIDYERWFKRCLHPEDRSQIRGYLSQALAAKESELQVEFRILHPRDGIRWHLSISRPIWSERGELLRLSGITFDITDRKEAEIALQQSEAKLSQILNSAIAAIVQFHLFSDNRWEYHYFSNGCETLYGYTAAELLADGNLWISRVLPEDRETVLLPTLEQFVAEASGTIEYRFQRRDGSLRWIAGSYQSKRIAADCWQITLVDRDITERKLTEIALQQSEAQLSQIMNSALGSIARFQLYSDLSWHNDFFSSGSEGVYGYQPEEFMAEPRLWLSRVDPEDRETVILPVLEKLAAGESAQIEYRFRHRDGSWRWLSTAYTPQPTQPDCWQVTSVTQDITARKQAEIALQRSEAKFRHFAENSQAAIWMAEPVSLKPTYVSPAYETIWGKSNENLMAQPESWLNSIHPEDREWILANYIEQRHQGASKLEYRIRRPNGEVRWICDWGFPIYNEAGEIYSYGGFAEDITERKLAEIALQQSEAKFRHFAENSHAIIWIAEPSALIPRYVSPAYETIWGKSCQSLIEQPESWLDSIHPEDRDRIASTLLQQRQQASSKLEYRIVRPDGEVRWICDWGFPIYNEAGEIYSYGGFAEDITERKLAEIALQQSEAKFRHFAENSHVIIWMADVTPLQNQYVSPAYETIWGQSRQSLTERPEAWLEVVHPEDRAIVEMQLERQTQGQASDAEYRIVRPDGSVRWIYNSSFPIHNEAGEIYAFGGMAEDISDRKLAEIALRESETRFRHFAENSHALIWIAEAASFANQYVSPSYETIWGRSRESLSERPESWLDAIHPDDLAIARAQLEQKSLGNASTAEYRIVRPDGSVRWVSNASFPIRNEAGEIYGFGGVTEDISDRKLAEIALRESEARLSASFSYAAVGMAMCDLQGCFIQINSALCEITGYSEAELMGLNFSAITHPDEVERERRCFEQLLAGEIRYYHLEKRYIHKQGHIIWSFVSVALVRDEEGQPLHSIGQIQDITERKLAEIARRESDVRFYQAFNYAAIGMTLCDLEGNFMQVNQALCEITGYSEAELLKMNFADITHPDDLEIDLGYVRKLLAGEIGFYHLEKRYIHKQRYIVWILLSGTLVRDEQGQPLYSIGQIQNITARKRSEAERKLAENALRESEARFSAAFNYASIGMSMGDLEGRFLQVNQALCDLTGYSQAELLEMNFADITHPDDLEADRNSCREAIAGEIRFYHLEKRYIHKQGHRVWILLSAALVRDEQGKPFYFVAQMQDISARKEAELRLQQQVRRDKLVADMARDIRQSLVLEQVLSRTVERVREALDSDRAVIFRFRPNGYAEAIVESSGEDWLSLLGTCILDPCFRDRYAQSYERGRVSTISDLDRAEIDSCYVELLKRLQVRASLVVAIVQGEKLWGLLVTHHCAAPHQWQTEEIELLEQLATHVSIAIQQSELYEQTQRELSERKAAEQKIQEQAALLDITSDAIFARDFEHRILYWNLGAERMYGWSASEALGRKANELLRENPEQLSEIMQTLWESGEWHGELRKIAKTGREIIVEGRWTLALDTAGQPKFILSVNTDITERKQLEAQFYRAQRLESLGTLASGIAHDLNNVLTPVVAIAQVLRMRRPDLDERSLEMLKILEESAKRGAKTLEQILTFTRGRGEEREPVSIAPLLQEVVSLIQQTLPKSIAIHRTLPNSMLWWVSANSTYLQQVFINLCVNARDAMPDGGILSLSAGNFIADRAFVQANLEARVGRYVVVTVADTGTGIPVEVRDRLFEPFFTTKPVGKGTGLGLATVLGIVKNYGGFVQVFSEVGRGTEVKVYLPALEGNMAMANEREVLWEGNGETIAIVDDDVAVLESTRSLLEGCHYKVLSASNGADAIALYERQKLEIRAVIVDMTMPEMSGTALIQCLKEIDPSLNVIAMSGLAANRAPALAAGAKVFLAKPYLPQKLLEELQALNEGI